MKAKTQAKKPAKGATMIIPKRSSSHRTDVERGKAAAKTDKKPWNIYVCMDLRKKFKRACAERDQSPSETLSNFMAHYVKAAEEKKANKLAKNAQVAGNLNNTRKR
jgi:hypothetical protein